MSIYGIIEAERVNINFKLARDFLYLLIVLYYQKFYSKKPNLESLCNA